MLSVSEGTYSETNQPAVIIDYPTDGEIFYERNITIHGFASASSPECQLNYWEYTWQWESGSITNSSYFDPVDGVEFWIHIHGLALGANTITVTFGDICEQYGTDSVTVYYEDNDPPEVVITYPPDESEFDDPYISVEGYISDHGGSGVVTLTWTHTWEDGEEGDTEYFDIPYNKIIYEIPIVLEEGENVITVTATDLAGNEPEYPTVIHVYYKPEEGLLFDAVFQPVQTVYPSDPTYGEDIKNGPCWWDCDLDMVAGKNTYLFGHPYNDRNSITITVHNNYKAPKTFSFVFKIYPDNKIIWRSDPVTIPAKTKKTFTYQAPLPDTPFQWEYWGNNPKEKDGEVVLYLDPDPPVKSPADCNCQQVTVRVKVKYTHDLKVLFIPFTFTKGPNFPAELSTPLKITKFDKWRLFTLEPWWNAIYPVRESGLDTEYFFNVKEDITVDGIKVDSLAKVNTLTKAQLDKLQDLMLSKVLALSWVGGGSPPFGIGGWDRIVLLVHPKILSTTGGVNGLAYLISATGPTAGQMKQGVWVNWDTRTKTAAHEVSHTYGLKDCYKPPDTQSDAIGYWVNKKIDIINKKDLMWSTHPVNDSWIKKPNFKSLLKRFNEQRDPEVLGISGFIDKNNNVELNPWYKLDNGNVDLEWNTTGNYLLNGYNDNGDLIAQAGFNISFIRYEDPDSGEQSTDEMLFAFRVEWIDELHRIDIVNATTQEILATRVVSPNPPEITITAPSPGEKIKQKPYEITWEGDDADGDTLTYNLFLSNDSGQTWFPISWSVEGDSFTADFTYLPEGAYQIKLFATDGVNTAEDISSFGIKTKIKNTLTEQLFDHILGNKPINQSILPFLEHYPHLFPLIQQLLLQ